MTRCSKFPECESCINRELDPFACDDCTDANNYEPDEDLDTADTAVEELSYADFIELFRNAA